MYQDHQQMVTIRTLECDICERFDSIMLKREELIEKVNSNSLQIGSKILSHNDHLRIVYFDIQGRYLGDTMSLNFSNKPLIDYSKEIPFLIQNDSIDLSFHRKLLRYFVKMSYKISIIGPSMAGKTSLALFLESGLPERITHRVNHSATMGKSVKRFDLANNHLTIFDMGGQKDFWGLWGESITASQKVIYVLDGAANNINELKSTLSLLVKSIDPSSSLLIINNKMDLFNEGYTNSFVSPEQIISIVKFPDDLKYWIIEASIYNGKVYNYTSENEESSLSDAIIDFLER